MVLAQNDRLVAYFGCLRRPYSGRVLMTSVRNRLRHNSVYTETVIQETHMANEPQPVPPIFPVPGNDPPPIGTPKPDPMPVPTPPSPMV